MINRMKKSIATRRRGFWFTTRTGQHIYVDEDETPKQACERVYKERSEEREKVVTPSDVDKLYGEEFKGYKGQAAIDKLLKEQRGHVKGAFHRDDIGDIDLVWGSDTAGLQHIIKQRSAERKDEAGKIEHVEEIMTNISDIIESGACQGKNRNGNFEIFIEKGSGKYFAIVAPEYHNYKVTYIITAYRRSKKKEH